MEKELKLQYTKSSRGEGYYDMKATIYMFDIDNNEPYMPYEFLLQGITIEDLTLQNVRMIAGYTEGIITEEMIQQMIYEFPK